MIKTYWIAVASFSLLVVACDRRVAPQRDWRPEDHGQPAQGDIERTPPEEREAEQGGPQRAAEALYTVSCAGCHGRDGRGQGTQRPPGAQLPDFTSADFQRQRSDDQLLQVIRDGRGLMPGFGKQVNEQGQSALVGRVRSFAAP